MQVLGVVLARGGSKGVPGKHLRELGGKPLINWTLDEVIRCQTIDNFVLSSDDPAILHYADVKGMDTVEREAHLAQDTTPTLPALINAVECMEDTYRKAFDYIVEIRATTPFKTAADIDAMVRLLIASGADSVIGVTPVYDHHPSRLKWLDTDGYIHDFLPEPISGRRQDLTPQAYVRNGTVYALRREWVMGAAPKLFGHEKSIAYVMEPEKSINIDTPMDWALAESMLVKA
jgi:CMP-N,N'-diacetyllegionaminic acid synthase